jgi:hypothetical protein
METTIKKEETTQSTAGVLHTTKNHEIHEHDAPMQGTIDPNLGSGTKAG